MAFEQAGYPGKSYSGHENYQQSEVVPNTALQSVYGMTNSAIELSERVLGLVDRSLGPTPVPASNGSDQKMPSGSLAALKSHSEYVASRIQAALNALSQLERELN